MWTAKEAGPCHKFLSVATHQRGKDWRLEVGGGGRRKERKGEEGGAGWRCPESREQDTQNIVDDVGV